MSENINIEVTDTEVKPEEVAAEIEQAVKKTRQPRAPKAAPVVEKTEAEFVVEEILAEVGRQDAQWGEQNHPFIGGFPERERVLVRNYGAKAAELKGQNNARVQADTMGWDSILLEEVYEALCEKDQERAEYELVQVGAVVVNALLSLRRQDAA